MIELLRLTVCVLLRSLANKFDGLDHQHQRRRVVLRREGLPLQIGGVARYVDILSATRLPRTIQRILPQH